MTRLVLVGGGHAHLPALKEARVLLRAGADLTLVAPGPYHYYSGMGPGILSGTYRPQQARIAVERLVRSRGGRYLQGKVVALDPHARRLSLDDGSTLPYDLVSFNTGSRVPSEGLVDSADDAVPVKPIENMMRARQILLKRGAATTRVLVAGGGPGGVELAGNLWKLARDHRLSLEVTVMDAESRLLSQMPAAAGRIAQAALATQGTRFCLGTRLQKLGGKRALTADGRVLSYDLAFLTLGIVPHRFYADSGLATGAQGGMLVNDSLQAVDHPEIFGGGDCISLSGNPLPRIGVYAIRQGPTLLQNLLGALGGLPPVAFKPQRRFLLILNLGDGTGIVVWGPLVWRGRLAFRWKDHLDTSFMHHFQVSGELSESKG